MQGADIGVNFLRADSLAFEPVIVSAALLPADVGILTTTNLSSQFKTDTTDVVYNFDDVSLLFFAVVIFIASVTITASSLLGFQAGGNLTKKIVTKFKQVMWDIGRLVIDQESFDSKTWSIRFVWASLNIVCFVLIFGYFWNLMSTEQSVKKEPPAIDSLKDLLYDSQFRHIRPVLSKMFYLYNVLILVPPASDEGVLFKRMLRIGNTSIIESDASKGIGAMSSGPLKGAVDDLIAGKVALLSILWVLETLELLLPKENRPLLAIDQITFL